MVKLIYSFIFKRYALIKDRLEHRVYYIHRLKEIAIYNKILNDK